MNRPGVRIEFSKAARRIAISVLAVAGTIACGIASGQDSGWTTHPALQDRWQIMIGAYAPKVSTIASLNGSGGRVNASVNFEDELDLSDRKVLPDILGSVRLGQRWKIEAEYFSLHRTGTRPISRTIDWGDNTYTLGTVVTSTFDSDIYRLSAGYSFIKDDKKELGAVLGLHVTDFQTSLSAAGVGTSPGDTLAPLPTIGAYGSYAFAPRWMVSGRVDYFSLNYDDYDGSLLNFSVGVDYRFTRTFGVGLAYRYVDYDVKVTKSKYNGSIEYKFDGPMLYGVASF
jgi:hypothetical protein